MARNHRVYYKDILNSIKPDQECRSKYIKNKEQYINRKYNSLYLKDIICAYSGHVYGVCDCDCGEKDIVTAIHKLVNGETFTCGCSRQSGNICNAKYDNPEYIGKIYKSLKVIGYKVDKIDDWSGVIWELECLNCGRHIEMKATYVVNGTTASCGCLGESRNNKYSDKDLEGTIVNGTKILKILDKNYKGQYWLCECRYCKKAFKVLGRKIYSGHTNSCGCNTESIGVVEIKKYLDRYNIKYEQEWKTPELLSQYGYMLRFDFAIKNLSDQIVAFIEYDGMQHYEFNRYTSDDVLAYKQFKDIQDSDKRKNTFCSNKNIPLLRIIYSRKPEVIIDELDSFINKLKLSKGETLC